MAGLPLDSWILIVSSVGLGLGIELAFLRARRVEDPAAGSGDPDGFFEGPGPTGSPPEARP